jgi:hypothetical protein
VQKKIQMEILIDFWSLEGKRMQMPMQIQTHWEKGLV